MKRTLMPLAALALVAGCSSPEATRSRGGGPGADIGNRPERVLMHEGSRPYWKTPVHIPTEAPSIAPSEQARQLSLPSRANTGSSADENSTDAARPEGGR